jgi:hypothetical protein
MVGDGIGKFVNNTVGVAFLKRKLVGLGVDWYILLNG